MSEEKQIEEMAHDLCGRCQDGICVIDGRPCNLDCTCHINATTLYEAGYRKQSEGKWLHDTNLDTFYCSICDESALNDCYEHQSLSGYCPNCGAKMKGGAE